MKVIAKIGIKIILIINLFFFISCNKNSIKTYYKNGNKKEIYCLKNAEKYGKYTLFNKNGSVNKKVFYNNIGQIDSSFIYEQNILKYKKVFQTNKAWRIFEYKNNNLFLEQFCYYTKKKGEKVIDINEQKFYNNKGEIIKGKGFYIEVKTNKLKLKLNDSALMQISLVESYFKENTSFNIITIQRSDNDSLETVIHSSKKIVKHIFKPINKGVVSILGSLEEISKKDSIGITKAKKYYFNIYYKVE